ncbi:Octaprenyl diphosphate synthase [hydrothermal vent metagenome]|uniref:Octaprenyl diphosphate synthase n=1 Tax=hydrothermal vent metagenome TaxID=652676 RepID=A0A3B1AWE2_9ZZZZ
MDITAIRELIADDLTAIDKVIIHRLKSDVVLINQIGAHIVYSGGKRMRPLVVLLAARAFGYEGDKHCELAAVVEFIHTATLLHDDVVDASDKRRSQDTANALWGNSASVLSGDFLYSRSFEMMVDVGIMRVLDILSHASNQIAEGEVLQLLNCNNPDTTEAEYMKVIYRKTATLFEAGAKIGPVLVNAPPEQEQAMADYGKYLGTAFQLIDDVMDYSATSEEMGKNVGDDLAEGKPTLPLIRAMEKGTQEQKELIRNAIEHGGLDQIDAVTLAIESTDAIEYTAKIAQQEADKAKAALKTIPPSRYRDALESLVDLAVNRSS